MMKIKMSSLMFLTGAAIIAIILNTVSSQSDNTTESISVRWSLDAPASLTVKKASRRSNVKEAFVLTREHAEEIVKRHNQLRTIVQPSAAKMRKMSWDNELQIIATRYTRKCIYEHNKAREHSRFPYIGENLYISTGIGMDTDLVVNAVSAWDNEKVFYDYETRKCTPGEKCGHYTQTAWDDSFKVGCGITICKSVEVNGRMWKDAVLFGCNYGPGGNYDRHPFVAGRSCTACDEGDVCEDKLCANKIRDEDNDGSSASWGEWSNWSTCSKTCIGGMATRTRSCSSFIEGDCDGENKEFTFTCSTNLCGIDIDFGKGISNTGDEDFLSWEEWSECSKTCGHGVITRTRQCKNPMRCSGINRLSNACYKRSCPESGTEVGWTQWGGWESCSVTCGKGVQVKKRSCGGSTCPGQKDMEKGCRLSPCVTDPVWSSWSNWGVCSTTCGGGRRSKKRNCLTGRNCVGEKVTRQSCNVKRCPAIWSKWTSWGACSVTCAGGSKFKTRKCLTGRNCEGATEVTDACNTLRCPGVFSLWSSWSVCSKSCGSATRTRTRTCVGGRDCRGSNADRESCFTRTCPEYNSWSSWGPCDVSCGSGNRIKTRTCSSINVDDCDGEANEATVCHQKKCTKSGWSPWSLWGSCSVSCGGGQQISTRVCNIGNTGPSTCPEDYMRRRSCSRNKCPKLSTWSKWSTCDVACGEGLKTRMRTCQNGVGCVGKNTESTACKDRDCTKSRWDKWSMWSKCAATCGEGSQSRRRMCLLGDGAPCTGENNDIRVCELTPCDKDEKDLPNEGPDDRQGVPDGSDGSSDGKDNDGGGASATTSSTLQILIFTFITVLLNTIYAT